MKRNLYIVLLAGLVLGGYFVVDAIFSPSQTIPTIAARRGEFVISLNENGTVQAKRAVGLSAPRVRGMQITWLAPEGSVVAKGDPVIRFDASKQEADLAEHESTLKIKKTALSRARQEFVIQEKQLTLNLEKARRTYLEKKHEARRVAEESRMEKELAELNFEAKLDQLTADVEKAELEVQRASDKVNLAQKELSQTVIVAPIPGMVVYLEIWKGGQMSKVQEGDSPWPGQQLVNLPDLSEMMVETAVSEVDASKVDSGQNVVVTLDAFPDNRYVGTVTRKGTLARKKDNSSTINVFDVEVTLEDPGENFKPGMSASCRIIVKRIDDMVSIPLEAVFERDGATVVYLKNKKRRDVTVGLRNDIAIEIVSGLEGGEDVCLLDPTLDEQGLPGDRATEPELNKRPESKKKPAGRGRGRGRKKG
ncbi:MAG: efflux RND transporter periplasmic adaptor subunit [Candidatus Zixiibacteriota bacterium]